MQSANRQSKIIFTNSKQPTEYSALKVT